MKPHRFAFPLQPMAKHAIVLGLALFACVLLVRAQEKIPQQREQGLEDQRGEIPRQQDSHANPSLLSFDDLVALSSTAQPQGPLAARLDTLLTTPFLSSAANAQPHRPQMQNLDPVLRVALWNIERGLNFEMIESTLANTNDFERFEKKPITGAGKALIESRPCAVTKTIASALWLRFCFARRWRRTRLLPRSPSLASPPSRMKTA